MILHCKDCKSRHYIPEKDVARLILKKQGMKCHSCYSKDVIDVRCGKCGIIFPEYTKDESEQYCHCTRLKDEERHENTNYIGTGTVVIFRKKYMLDFLNIKTNKREKITYKGENFKLGEKYKIYWYRHPGDYYIEKVK